MTLNSTPSRNATYVSGSGTSALVFEYAVQAGDSDARVDYATTSALTLNGGTIKDALTNSATLTLPSIGSSGLYTQNIKIDTAPLAVTVNQSSSQADPAKTAPISFDVVFSKAINVATFTTADITQSGTATGVTWSITDSGDHLNFVLNATAVGSNGTVVPTIAANVINDTVGNNNTASTSTDHSVTYDTVSPTVLSVTSTTATGTYTTGSIINVTVNFSEAVTVSTSGGIPAITLNTTPSRNATYVSGSGTSALVFGYTVQAGDSDARVDYTSTSALGLNGGTIKDAATNTATLTLPATASSGLYSQNINIDANNLAVTINQKLVQADPTKTAPISFDVVFSKAINVATFTTADITQSGTATGVTWSITDSGDHLNFVLNATAVGSNGTVVPTIASNLINDTVGNNNTASTSTDHSVTYDTVQPQITSVSSTNATGTYAAGSVISVTVSFGESVSVITTAGMPTIALNTTPSRTATYSSGSGTTTLTFNYTVQTGDSSSNLDYSSTSAISLNNGVIQDVATNAAVLTLPATGTSTLYGKAIVVDSNAPSVTIAATSSTANPTTKTSVPMTVTFSESVTGFDSSDLSVTGGVISNFIATSGSIYTFEFIPTSNSTGTFSIDIAAGAAKDAANNNSTAATQFSRTFYTQTPTLTGTTPTNITTPILTVGNIISGLTANLYKNSACSVTADASVASTGTTQNLTSTTISTNTNYYADVTDSNGVKSSCSSVFALNFDNSAPTIAISAPSANTYISASTDSATYSVSGTCSESSQTVTIYLDGSTSVGTASCNGTSFLSSNVNTTTWAEGTHALTATISDTAGNTTTSASITVKRDVTAPTLPTPLAWSVAGTATNSTNITASWTKSVSTDLANQKIQLYTGAACNTTSGSLVDLASASLQTKAFTGTNGTIYTYKITNIDLAGNSSVSGCSSSMLVDTTAPFSSTSLGWNGAASPSTTASLTASWTKSTSSDAANQKILFYSDGACATQIGSLIDLGSATTQSYSFTAPGNGTYSFDINTYDAAGNVSNSGCSSIMTVSLPPLVMTPGNFVYPAGKTDTVTFTASGGSGSGYVYSVLSGPGSIGGSTGIYTGGTSRVPGGTSTVVKVTDSAGTSVTTTITHAAMSVNGTVYATATDASGNIYVGGSFNAVNMDYASGFMPVSSTTGAINDYGLASGFNSGAKINAILISGSHAFVGGLFTSYRGTTVQNLAKINLSTGALDTTFTQTTGPTSEVSSLAINGTSLYVGGFFDGYRSTASGLKYLIKVDTTSGNLDTGFVSTAYTNAGTNSVFALAVANGGLYVGGLFQGYAGGTSSNTAIKVDLATGALAASYQGSTSGSGGAVNAMAVSSTYLYLGGSFTQWKNGATNSDTNFKRLIRINLSTGALDNTFMNGSTKYPNNTVRALALSSDGNHIFVGGDFNQVVADSKGTYLAKISVSTGALDITNFNSYVIAAGGAVNSLNVNGNDLYVGGSFSAYRSSALGEGLIKVDATTGVMDTTNFNTVKTGPNGTVNALALSGSTLYAGGTFSYYRGNYVENLAKFTLSNWALDTTFTQSTGPNDTVRAIAVSGSSVYVGGDFVTYRGDDKGYRLAKLDATTGNMDTANFNTTASAGPENGNVFSILVNGNDLFIGGAFNSYRGSGKGYFVAKLNATTGVMDTTNFNTTSGSGPNNTVYAMAFNAAKTKIYLGGLFTSYRSSAYGYYVIAINPSDGSYDTTVICGNGTPNNAVNAIAVSGTNVYLGGSFTQFNANPRGTYLVKLSSTGVMDTSFNSVSSNNGPGAYVNAIAPSLDGSYLYIGGAFTTYKTNTKGYYLAKVSTSDAALEVTNFNTTANTGPNAIINSIQLSSDGTKIYVGGTHSTYRGSTSAPFMTSVSTTNGAISY